jgi:hypothetical protein
VIRMSEDDDEDFREKYGDEGTKVVKGAQDEE